MDRIRSANTPLPSRFFFSSAVEGACVRVFMNRVIDALGATTAGFFPLGSDTIEAIILLYFLLLKAEEAALR